MKTTELFEALRVAGSNDNHPISKFELPVACGEDKGFMPLVQVLDSLVTYGNITENTMFCVEFQNEEDEQYTEDWVTLKNIETNGQVTLM